MAFLRSFLLILTSALCALALAPAASAQEELPALLNQVRKQEDKVDRRIFARIASFKTEDSHRTLRKAVAPLRREQMLTIAYGAFLAYRDQPKLAAQSVQFLHDEALRQRRDENQRSAARALARYGALARSELEHLLKRHRSEDVRRIVAQPMIPLLGDLGTVEAAEMILRYADLRSGAMQSAAFRALQKCTGAKIDRLLGARLNAKGTNARWRLLLLDLLSRRQGSEVDRALLAALDSTEPEVRVQVIEILGERRDPALLGKLTPHLRARHEGELREAIIAVGQLSGADKAWVKQLFEFSRSKNAGARMGAAVALLELRTQDAVDKLHHLLADPDWRVRSEALQQVGNLHQSQSLPFLIERLRLESGRLKRDVGVVLRLLTGLDHGYNVARWDEWYRAEGDEFDLPSYADALLAEEARKQRHDENITVATFYGLEVVSERVAFALDISGSMNAPAGSRGRTSTQRNTSITRLTVAKQELERALRRISPGVQFNLFFFGSRIRPWKPELVAKDEELLEEALEFSRGQRQGGGTNIYDALMAAFADGRVDTIYLLSDGDPSAGSIIDPGLIRERIARYNRARKVQIHCISIGKPSPFLRQLARENGGVYTESL